MLSRLLLASFLAAAPSAQNWFQTPRVFDRYGGELRAVADFDRDGSLDLLRFQGSSSQNLWSGATPLFGLGTGAFTPGPTLPLDVNSAQLVAVADFDGDQQPDLIASTNPWHPSGPGLSYFRGLPAGAFATPVHTPLPRFADALAVGRANGDALPDLAVLVGAAGSPGPTVRWLLGVAAQAPAVQPAFTFPTPFVPYGLAPFDRDGDGDDDLAVTTSGSLLLLDTQNGGLLASGQLGLPTPAFCLPFGLDLEGDLDDDLLVLAFDTFTSTRAVRVHNQGGALTTTSQVLTTPSTRYWRPGDWDGDGDQDLVVRTDLGLSLFENTGGAFVARSSCPLDLPATTSAPGLFDVDGDGHLDVVDAMAVWFGDGTFDAPASPMEASSQALRDWEGDGDLDLLRDQGGILRNDGRGEFTVAALAFPTPGPNLEYRHALVVADFDGDGRAELLCALYHRDPNNPFLVTFQGMARLEDTGAGTLVDRGIATGSVLPMRPRAFATDASGDGILDVVDETGVWVNSGTHQFVLLPHASAYTPMVMGDVDGDGDDDFLAGYAGSTRGLAILRLVAPNTYATQVLSAPTASSSGSHVPVLADLDDDGDLDIAADRSYFSGAFEVWRNQGGAFTLAWASTWSNASILGSRAMAGDVDVDGRTDLAFAIGNTMRVFRRRGAGLTYDDPSDYQVAGAKTLTDLDGDGDVDVLGSEISRNRRLVMPFSGQRRQYGTASPGTSGIPPVLGCSGPVRVIETPVLRLRDALGGSFSLLGMGFQPATFASPVIPGLIGYTFPLAVTIGFVVGGTPGAPGAGTLDVPLAIPAGFGGVQLYFQHFVFDAGAPNGIPHTNGLELTIGG